MDLTHDSLSEETLYMKFQIFDQWFYINELLTFTFRRLDLTWHSEFDHPLVDFVRLDAFK